MTITDAIELAKSVGFSHAGELNLPALQFHPEVREMCAADRCGAYNKSWMCPPQCGTLEEISGRAKTYHRGILVQSTGQMEDDFDIECMMETERLHKERFHALVAALRETFPNLLPMAAGACTVCKSCAFPEEPCRFPEKAYTSMEAYGLVVSDVCTLSGMQYYYGKQTMTYTSCILMD